MFKIFDEVFKNDHKRYVKAISVQYGGVAKTTLEALVGPHRVRQRLDSEGAGRLADEVADPGAAVLGLVAAEEGPADAARPDVVGAWVFIGDQRATGEGHIASIRTK